MQGSCGLYVRLPWHKSVDNMILRIYQGELNSKEEYNIKQLSLLGDNFAVMLNDGSFKFFLLTDNLVEVLENKNENV